MTKRPNILIFMSDQEQGAVVQPEHPCRTPHAEQLAADGISFRQAYCPTAHCCPSRATLFTGLYPSRHGVYNNVSTPTAIHHGPFEGTPHWSQSLKSAGYNLGFSGKWHVSNYQDPCDFGWEHGIVTAGRGSYMQTRPEKWRQMTSRPDYQMRRRGEILRPGWGDLQLYGTTQQSYEELHDYKVTQSGIDLMQRYAQENEPWCVYIGVLGPHDPFRIPEKYAQMYDPSEVSLPPNFHDTLEDKPRIYQRMHRQYWSQLSEEEVRESIAHYWGYCTLVDDLFGETLNALETTGQADNTLVLRVSDHGEYAGAHGLCLKGVPAFREAYHVVASARWPQGIEQPGLVVDDFVSLADIAPTLIEASDAPNLKVPDGKPLSGNSLMPFLKNENPKSWRDAIHTQFNGVELYYSQRSVSTREWKYVYNGFDDDELYNLQNDPHELVNLALYSEYDDVKRELVRRMWQFAEAENDDIIFNAYGTVALRPFGPADALS